MGQVVQFFVVLREKMRRKYSHLWRLRLWMRIFCEIERGTCVHKSLRILLFTNKKSMHIMTITKIV